VTDTHDAAGPEGKEVQPVLTDEQSWSNDLEKWMHTRLDLVQDSAKVWLGVLTTLLGLLGSVVLLKGGDLITGVTASAAYQRVLFGLVILVFASSVLAVLAGGAATWGGLKNPEVPSSGRGGGAWWWRRALFGVVVWLAFLPRDSRTLARRALQSRADDAAAAGSTLERWKTYKKSYEQNGEIHRAYLHASRTLGVAAAVLIAALAIVAVRAGTVAPAPSEVIVVHSGRLSCVPASNNMTYKGVTQVVPVNSC
jgi:hypothetical protein